MARGVILRARFFVASDGTCVKKAWPASMRQKFHAFERGEGRCHYCGVALGWMTPRGETVDGTRCPNVDHVVPRCRGGQNNPENLVISCESCNSRKGHKLLHEMERSA